MDFYEWDDSSSDSFLLTINTAVIHMFYDLWIYIINGFEFFYGKIVRFQHVLEWCLCEDKPYGTISLITISFFAYNENYKLWSFYHFIFEHRQSHCISTEACLGFLVAFILLLLYFFVHFLCYIMYDWVYVTIANLTLLLFLFITNYPIRKNICQVINYNRIRTIKREWTYGKSSIFNQSRL